MSNNNTISDKQLKDLFKQIGEDSPSSDFMENLMDKVKLEALKQVKRQKYITFLQMTAGILAILIFPVLYIYFAVPDFFSHITLPRINLKLSPTITITGLNVLFLLVADILLRQYYFSKKRGKKRTFHCR